MVGEMPDPLPEPGEVRIQVAASGINPGDVKKRQDNFGVRMPFPRVIPHSDGAGTIDAVGEGVPESRVGERVWCFWAQSYRPFGTAAEYVVVPTAQAVPLSAGVPFEQGACLGIPGITAHQAVLLAITRKCGILNWRRGGVRDLPMGSLGRNPSTRQRFFFAGNGSTPWEEESRAAPQ